MARKPIKASRLLTRDANRVTRSSLSSTTSVSGSHVLLTIIWTHPDLLKLGPASRRGVPVVNSCMKVVSAGKEDAKSMSTCMKESVDKMCAISPSTSQNKADANNAQAMRPRYSLKLRNASGRSVMMPITWVFMANASSVLCTTTQVQQMVEMARVVFKTLVSKGKCT